MRGAGVSLPSPFSWGGGGTRGSFPWWHTLSEPVSRGAACLMTVGTLVWTFPHL